MHVNEIISIHALRKESDRVGCGTHNALQEFQSTLSVRRATGQAGQLAREAIISIHALRKESDFQPCSFRILLNISIHALRKESDI